MPIPFHYFLFVIRNELRFKLTTSWTWVILPVLANFQPFGQIFIALNDQILKNYLAIWSHWFSSSNKYSLDNSFCMIKVAKLFISGDSLYEGLMNSPIFQSMALVSQDEVRFTNIKFLSLFYNLKSQKDICHWDRVYLGRGTNLGGCHRRYTYSNSPKRPK